MNTANSNELLAFIQRWSFRDQTESPRTLALIAQKSTCLGLCLTRASLRSTTTCRQARHEEPACLSWVRIPRRSRYLKTTRPGFDSPRPLRAARGPMTAGVVLNHSPHTQCSPTSSPPRMGLAGGPNDRGEGRYLEQKHPLQVSPKGLTRSQAARRRSLAPLASTDPHLVSEPSSAQLS